VEPAPNACPVPLSPHTAGPCGFSPHRSSAMTRLDRLARSTRDLLNIVAEIREAGAGFKSLSDAWADTTTPHGRLLTVVLGGLAEFERDLIAARTGEGRARAKARGVKFGRPPALTPHQRSEALQRLREARRKPTWRGPTGFLRRRSAGLSPALSSRWAWPITPARRSHGSRPMTGSRPCMRRTVGHRRRRSAGLVKAIRMAAPERNFLMVPAPA
jgi:hypothetical protein